MKIVCLLGSPKGEYSVTLHYLKFIAGNFSEHEFQFVNIGGRIKRIMADPRMFGDIIKEVRGCDGIIWAAPVYFGSVPAQMKQFIEAVFAGPYRTAFKDKYAMSLITSMNFYDHTALHYLQAVSEDLDMQFVQGHAYDRVNFKRREERENLLKFISVFLGHVREGRPTTRECMPLPDKVHVYAPAEIEESPKQSSRKIVLLTDAEDANSNLARMTAVFVKSSPCPVEVVNIREMGLRGGCTGCFSCGYDGTCAYQDGFAEAYRSKFLAAEAVVFAITTKDRFLSAQWKMFFDRSLFNGRKPERSGPQVGYLVSGPLRQLTALREFLVGHAEMAGRNIVGFVTDEYDRSAQITALLTDFARRMAWSLEQNAQKPATFLGVAAQKVLRDRTYLGRLAFRRDHRALKDEGFYDFPRLPLKLRLLDLLLGRMLKNPQKRQAFYRSIPLRMLDEFTGHVEIGRKTDRRSKPKTKQDSCRLKPVASKRRH